MSDRRHCRQRIYGAVGLLTAVTVPQFLLGLGDRNIWIPLEARYALVAREMLEAGHWVLPHLGGEVYADKPPLLFWSIALVSTFGSGVTEWSARLPTGLAAIAVCLVTWRMGVRLFSPTTGLLAALVLATSGGFFWSGRQALPDMLLTLWMTGACWALSEWCMGRGRQAAIAAGVCMGLATLTKGPVGVVLPTLCGLVYLTVRRHFRWPETSGRDVLMGGGAFLGVTLTWFVPAVAQGGMPYAQATLLHHSLQRYVSAWEHSAPWYFYLGAFPAEFLPWTLFLPQVLIRGVKQPPHRGQEGWWFALCWLVTILGFFSLSTGKRDIYILPAFPAAALLVGWVWSCWWRRVPDLRCTWATCLPGLGLALTFGGLAIGVWGAVDELLPSRTTLLLPATLRMRLWSGSLLMMAGLLLGGAAIARRTRLLFAGIVGCTWLTMLVVIVAIYTPQFNQRYPIKSFAATISAHIAPNKPLRLYGPMNDLALRFNMGRFVPELQHPSEVIRFLSGEEEAFCVIAVEDYQRLAELTGQRFPVVARQQFDRATLLLISNRW